MNSYPWFPFYSADWLASKRIAVMSPEQEGAYIRLLAYMWDDRDCSLADDDDELATLSRLNEGWLKGGSVLVRRCFMPHPEIEGRLTNERLWEKHLERVEWREKSRRGGIKSGRSRRSKSKGGIKGGSRVVEPKANNPESDPEPDLKKPPPTPPWGDVPRELLAGEFVERWKGYLKWRSQVLNKPWAAVTIRTRLKNLAEMGPDRAIAAMDYCMGQQYQGLFEKGANGKAGRDTSRPMGRSVGDRDNPYDKLGEVHDV